MTIYLGTIPSENVGTKKWLAFFQYYDIHKWVIAREEGRGGYKHWQVRFQTTAFDSDEGWEELKDWFKKGHFEKASDSWDYERKGGHFLTSDDTPDTLSERFRPLRDAQKRVLEALDRNNDREITVWVTSHGNAGKSWLCGALWERGLAHIVQPQNTAKGLIQDCASEFIEHGRRPYVIIDIPRTWKWTTEIYCAIESIKDGLIKDTRYGSRTINIRGVKVLVMSNTLPTLDKLSNDRWVILRGHSAWEHSP